MSPWRLVAASGVMTALAIALGAFSPAPAELVAVLTAPQQVSDTAGPDTVVLAGCALLAWLAWSWGAAGLALTAASAVPGVVGVLARAVLRLLLPAAGRRAAALVLGAGLGLGSPWLATAAPTTGATTVAAADSPAPDWPAAAADPGGPAPDWPDPAPPDAHVVVRGDCLWDI